MSRKWAKVGRVGGACLRPSTNRPQKQKDQVTRTDRQDCWRSEDKGGVLQKQNRDSQIMWRPRSYVRKAFVCSCREARD